MYYIEGDYFAIEGNWCDTLEFMRGDSFIHFQTLYSLSFRYDYERKTGYNIWHLQDLELGVKKKGFHRKLFFLYYDNPVILDWVESISRGQRMDQGLSCMFERIMCERMGYRGITKYLYEANKKDKFLKFMGTKPGTTIRVSVNVSGRISENEMGYITSASDFVQLTTMGLREINVERAAQCVYNGEISFVKSHSLDIHKIFRKERMINNGLTFKEAFVIAYLEQIAVHCIMHQEAKGKKDDAETLKFPMPEKGENQTQYQWQKGHLLKIIHELVGEESLDYYLVIGIITGLEVIPEDYFINYTEMKVVPGEMEENFLDSLMLSLDDGRRYEDNHKINHRYYLKTEFNGISSGEARMIDIFAMLYNSLDCCGHEKGETCVLLLDEPDMGFHPEWSRIFIDQLTNFLRSEMMRDYNYHIIITTHSPIMISDVPKNCIHCISKDENGKVTVIESNKYGIISGIDDVLIDAFFTDSLFGAFGEKYVNGIIKQIIQVENWLYSGKLNLSTLNKKVKRCDEIEEKIENLGDGYIKECLHRRMTRIRSRIKQLYAR